MWEGHGGSSSGVGGGCRGSGISGCLLSCKRPQQVLRGGLGEITCSRRCGHLQWPQRFVWLIWFFIELISHIWAIILMFDFVPGICMFCITSCSIGHFFQRKVGVGFLKVTRVTKAVHKKSHQNRLWYLSPSKEDRSDSTRSHLEERRYPMGCNSLHFHARWVTQIHLHVSTWQKQF